jgi:hypothetical protein
MLHSIIKLVCAELVEMRKRPNNNGYFNQCLDQAISALNELMMFL